MSEKLHIPSHRYGNKEYRDNFDRTFGGNKMRFVGDDEYYKSVNEAIDDGQNPVIVICKGKKESTQEKKKKS